MKNLLQKSLRQLTIFAFVVFALSVPSYFLLVDWIWLKELDENNELIAQRIENEFNDQHISSEKIAESIKFWNEIQPLSNIQHINQPLQKAERYTIRKKNRYTSRNMGNRFRDTNKRWPSDIPYKDFDGIDRFRVLKTNIRINDRNYKLTVETNVEETEETVAYIAMVTLLFFLILVVGFWILNRRLSKSLWHPFQDTLQKLKLFQLSSQQVIKFQKTDTLEFAELNATLDKLLQHSIATFKSQREFTENASHELQTPLAVLKSKLDILLQSNDLTERQYHIAEEMNKALTRGSRINKNLLLLAKIENNQFDSTGFIRFDTLLLLSIDGLQEYFKEKKLDVCFDIQPEVAVKGNSGLTEVLINNLLINAIRHTSEGGIIKIVLSNSDFKIINSGKNALDQNLLFKRFSKISADSSGNGLGLSIVQEICKLHQWQVAYNFENGMHIFLVVFRSK